MDESTLDIFSAARARRDVGRIREAVAEVKAGDIARVLVRSPRYGLYAIEGAVRIGVGGQPLVGDVILATSAEIQRIDLGIAAPEPALSADVVDPSTLPHGTPVRVTFVTPTAATFAVTGPITAGNDRFLLVGSWIVSDDRAIAPRVVSIERLDDVDLHEVNVPPLRSVLVDADA
ncbi:hypothetical protein [Microbacterium sp. RURRCA19A]|uniref:hypothetical protein n=1 Tax=Microbacterium sp. RURRCA19A TaxID=1907391 RepID=UPI000955E809|nr:hypothetical protein [Microbacterium sp. RURRCA19A]SIR94745.1 hypothetical protein SAMN05880568_1967 [Microbacterium sp. RURRCA19A]